MSPADDVEPHVRHDHILCNSFDPMRWYSCEVARPGASRVKSEEEYAKSDVVDVTSTNADPSPSSPLWMHLVVT